MIRLHVPTDLTPGASIAPTLDQSRYLTQVMRLKLGDSLLVFNGRDGEWRASIAEVLKKGVLLKAEEQTRPQTTGPDVHLLIAVVKKSALEFAVEKATELGVRRVGLVTTRRTQTEHVRLDRLDAIAIESAEQTGRLDVPEIDAPQKLDAILDGWDASRRLMFCDETGGEPVLKALSSFPPRGGRWQAESGGWGGSQPQTQPAGGERTETAPLSEPLRGPPSPARGEGSGWAILIGPEGGFSPEERDRLRALPFTTAVSLGPRVLRADTAAAAALTLWQAATGDWER